MKPDVIVSWPDNCDYPLWRKFVRNNRDRFGGIIVVLTKTNSGVDYSQFVRSEMGKLKSTVCDSPEVKAGEDWRNVAVNHALTLSSSEWVWFTEQDFYPNEKLWKEFEWVVDNGFVIGSAYQGERMHPCCILAKRVLVSLTRRNFGIVPGKTDHLNNPIFKNR